MWFRATFVWSVCASCGQLPKLDATQLTPSGIRDALEHFSGFYLTNHSLLGSLQTSMFSMAADFFSKPDSFKNKFHISQGLNLRWNEAGDEATFGKTDTRETLYIDPATACSSSTPTGQFLELRSLAYNISTISSAIGAQLLTALSTSLGLAPTFLDPFFPETSQPLLLTHSHKVPSGLRGSEAFNVGAHSDWGALTLLMLSPESHGLQMRCPLDPEQWLDVPPLAGALVVTAGDVLETWSAGRYPASVHRVRHVAERHRYSIPLFLDPRPELVIHSLLEGEGEEQGLPFRERSFQGLSNAFPQLSSKELRNLLV